MNLLKLKRKFQLNHKSVIERENQEARLHNDRFSLPFYPPNFSKFNNLSVAIGIHDYAEQPSSNEKNISFSDLYAMITDTTYWQDNAGNDTEISGQIQITQGSKPNLIFILGEAGIGKTKLLNHLFISLQKESKSCCIKTLDAEFNDNNTELGNNYYFFDALDEILELPIDTILESVYRITKREPQAWIFISCRTAFLKRASYLIANDSNEEKETGSIIQSQAPKSKKENKKTLSIHSQIVFALEIQPFSESNTIQALESHIDEQLSNEVIRIMRNTSLLKIPRYLEYVIQIVKRGGIDALVDTSTNRPTLSHIFEQIINLRLREEFNKSSLKGYLHELTYHREYAKLLQQKLALIMHWQRRSQLTERELAIFFDGIDSNFQSRFSRTKEVRYFFERSLLKPPGSWVEFENKDILDFLAAREILRLGETHLSSVVHEIVFTPLSSHISPHWWDVLFFVCEQDRHYHLLSELIHFCESVLISNKPSFSKVKGNYPVHRALIEQLVSRMQVENLPAKIKTQVVRFLIHHNFTYNGTNSYGETIDSRIISQIINSDILLLINGYFNKGYHKYILGVLIEVRELRVNKIVKQIDWDSWKSRFWNLIIAKDFDDYRFAQLYIDVFFNPYRFLPFHIRSSEPQDDEIQSECKFFYQNFIPFFDKNRSNIDRFSTEVQYIFYYQRIKSFDQLLTFPPAGIIAYAEWYALTITQNSKHTKTSLDKLYTEESWEYFLKRYNDDEIFRTAELKAEFYPLHEKSPYDFLESIVPLRKDSFAEPLIKAVTLSAKPDIRSFDLDNPMLFCWIRLLIRYYPEKLHEVFNALSPPPSSGLRFVLHRLTVLWPEDSITVADIVSIVKALIEQPKIAYGLLEDIKPIWQGNPKFDSLLELIPEQIKSERRKQTQQFEVEESNFESKESQNRSKTKQESESHLSALINLPQDPSSPIIHPIRILRYFYQSRHFLGESLRDFEQPIRHSLTSYLESYPDFDSFKVQYIAENKSYITNPESLIWELPIAIEVITLIPDYNWEAYQNLLEYSLPLLIHRSTIDWWKSHVFSKLNPDDFDLLCQKWADRNDDLIYFAPDTLCAILESASFHSIGSLNLLKRLLETPIKLAEAKRDFISVRSLTMLQQYFPDEVNVGFLKKLQDDFSGFSAILALIEKILVEQFQDSQIVINNLKRIILNIDFTYEAERKTALPGISPQTYMRGIGQEEQEVHTLINSTKKISAPEFLDHYFELLDAAITRINLIEDSVLDLDIDLDIDRNNKSAVKLIEVLQSYVQNLPDKFHTQAFFLLKQRLEEGNSKTIELISKNPKFKKAIDNLTGFISSGLSNVSLNQRIHEYNSLNQKRFARIYSSDGLFLFLVNLLKKDLKVWADSEGAFHLIRASEAKLREGESIVQALIKSRLDATLRSNGLEPGLIHLSKEEQKLDETRTDFLVRYGLHGPIVIEVKLAKNRDVEIQEDGEPSDKAKQYVDKMINYIEGFNATKAILLIVKTSNEGLSEGDKLLALRQLYAKEDRIVIIFIDGTPNSE